MTEKDYNSTNSYTASDNSRKNSTSKAISIKKPTIKDAKSDESDSSNLSKDEIAHLTKAGQIAQETIKFARSFIKKDMLLVEIADKIENKILELKGKPAFPVNLSINEVAAHATPLPNSEERAFGLLKVDIGVHIGGYVADTAFSLDLENSKENQSLIESAENAVKKACEIAGTKTKIREIGAIIEKTIKSTGFQPIQNLSGHSIEKYDLHAGVTIPNYDNHQEMLLEPGIYAIEPFVTTGLGQVRDGKPSSIYAIVKEGNVRDSFSREVLAYIKENYSTLPFCTRWIHKKFGSRSVIALKNIEQAGLLHQYPQLIESGKGKVAQAENTVIILKDKTIITTR
ncbi:MAG: type II methionyl aminopeptidase [Nanoarchaeota archaeon]